MLTQKKCYLLFAMQPSVCPQCIKEGFGLYTADKGPKAMNVHVM